MSDCYDHSYTANPRKLSFGNRIAYVYHLTNVQTTGSTLYTPFKKITGYMIETISPNTSAITVAANSESTGRFGQASLQFAVDAESQGDIIVVGLL